MYLAITQLFFGFLLFSRDKGGEKDRRVDMQGFCQLTSALAKTLQEGVRSPELGPYLLRV